MSRTSHTGNWMLDPSIWDLLKLEPKDSKYYRELYERGNKEAMDELVMRHMRWAAVHVRKCTSNFHDFQDYLSECAWVLQRALRNWTPAKGELTTYTGSGAFYRHLDRVQRYSGLFKMRLGPKDQVKAQLTPWDNLTARKLFQQNRLPEGSMDPTEKLIEQMDRDNEVKRLMKCLNPRERKIVKLVFGMGGRKPLSLPKAAALLSSRQKTYKGVPRKSGMCKESARRLLMGALEKMRAPGRDRTDILRLQGGTSAN